MIIEGRSPGPDRLALAARALHNEGVFRFSLILCFVSTTTFALPVAPRSEIVGDDSSLVETASAGKTDKCPAIYQLLLRVVGNVATAKCYLALFKNETTTCEVHLAQKKGHVGNPAAGYGLCTLEASPALREGRGPDCADISTAVNQIKCCRSIMRRSPSYFGGVNRGEIKRCH